MIRTPTFCFSFFFSQLGHQSTGGLAPAAGQEVRDDLEADLGHIEVEGHEVGHEIDPPEQRKTVISKYMCMSMCVVERFPSLGAIATCVNCFL